MPKPNRGPRLVFKQPVRYREPFYFIRWYEGGRKRERSTGTSDLKRAEQGLQEFLVQRARRPEGPRDPNETLIADVLAQYAEEHAPNVVDPARIGYANIALLDFWSDRPVSAITGNTCRAYVRHRQAMGRKTTTARRELLNLRAALTHCVREGNLTVAPELWYPETGDPKERWLTRQEAAAHIRAARGEPKARLHLPLFDLIGLRTGARKDAILTLQWMENTTGGWVDLDAELIYWRPYGRGQTKKRRPRATPIPSKLLRFLRYARRRTQRHVIEIDGERVKNIKRAFNTACNKAGLEDVTPHTLRHTCVTWMMQRGRSTWETGQFVGMSEQMVRERYGHHSPDHLHEAKEAANQ